MVALAESGDRDSAWLEPLQLSVQQGRLTGFALITVNCVCEPVVGPLQSIIDPQAAEPLPEEVLQCVRSFSVADEGPDTYELLGQRLQVVHRSSGSWYALSQRRLLGLAALQLPLGVLLVTFDRNTPLALAVSTVESAARKLRV